MNLEPLVTVAIPTHNRARLLRNTLESVLSQTFAEIEVVVSDNASSDDTVEVVESFADPRVTYTRLERNIGHLGNLSRCLGLGSAPFVAICQDDDLMRPDNIAKKYELLRSNEKIVFVHSAFSFIDTHGDLLNQKVSWWDSTAFIEEPEAFVRGTLKDGLRVDLSSPLIRRGLIGDEHFQQHEGLAADHGFFLRLGRKGKVAYIDEPLTASRRHAASLSVREQAFLLEGGFYAPSFTYSGGCHAVNSRFLERFGSEFEDVRELKKIAGRWARQDLASVVRANTGAEPNLRSTAAHIRKAVSIDPMVLATRRLHLVVAWALLGRNGRRLVRRLLPRLGAKY